ncbi:MAG: TIGR03087 family PEP-CTERM/XrtA system glycosyltransferase [Deferrisomatales bacterium]
MLVVAHRVPYPPNKGEKIRAFHEIRHLAEQGRAVYLCALADDPTDLETAHELRRWCRAAFVEPVNLRLRRWTSGRALLRGAPLSVPYFYSKRLQGRVDQVARRVRPQAVLCYSGPMAEYVFRSRALWLGRALDAGASAEPPQPPGGPRLVMDLVDVDSDKWAQYARRTRWPWSWVYRLESALLARYEARVARAFDAVTLVSPAEARLFQRRTGLRDKIHAVGNGVDLDYFRPGPDGGAPPGGPARPAGLVFCGAMDYYPNVDAAVWFAREVLPQVRRRVPGAEFTVVGSNPAPEVVALQDLPGVAVTGRVPDVRPHVGAAQVSVAPIRIARGVQNKVLEAMALGKPVVATPQAFEGLEAEPGRDLLVVPDRAAEFAEAVAGLLRAPERRRSLGAAARQHLERTYRWEAQLERLEALLFPRADEAGGDDR